MVYGTYKDLPRKTASGKILGQCFTTFLTKNQKILEPELFLKINSWSMNYTDPFKENLRDAKYIHLIEIEFVLLMLQTCNQEANTKRGSGFHCVFLIFKANIHGLFPRRTKKILQSPIRSSKFCMSVVLNQIKYG